MGILFTGTSLGGMIFPPVSTFLISHYGWRLALVIYGLFAFAVLAPLLCSRQNRPAIATHLRILTNRICFCGMGIGLKASPAVAAVVAGLIYSPVSAFLLGRFWRANYYPDLRRLWRWPPAIKAA